MYMPSFADPKHVIRANDPLLPKITIVEYGFLISEGSPVPEGIPLAGSSSSHQATEDKGDLGLFEEGFGVFDQADPSEDPPDDLGDPNLSEAELLSVGTSSRAEMGLKRKPPTRLFDLIEGQPGKGAQGKSQSSAPTPPPQPQPVQTKSSSSKSQPQSPRPKFPAPPQSAIPPRPEPTDPKRKRSPKGKEPMDGGKSQSSREGDETPRPQKQLKIGHQGHGKEIDAQSVPSTWLPAPMLHGEPLLEDASMRSLGDGEGGYVADALERTLLLPTDMEELKNIRMQEVFLSVKRYLGMAIQATYRMEEKVKGQSKAAKIERNKCIDAARTLKTSEADLAKAREDLKEATRAKDSAEEAEAARSEAAQLIVIPGESTEGEEPHEATEAPGGLNLKMPQEAARSAISAQISGAKEPALFVKPFQAIPLTDVSKCTEANPAQPSQEGDVSQGPEASPAQPSQDVVKTKLKK
ncbi:uncharacterized protein LOC115986171 [Quercus lobata]|uniref:uncharacterized protein LOC115986171 n=1 Tax=Quercus lobata TaxID=97700 RepID=UPI001243EEA4|nr:uncharacterized protein LOC115986171 [Quercus lobata]